MCYCVTVLNIINYLKHCISGTAVHTNDRDCAQQDGVVNKQFRLHRIVFDFCVCVCVPTTKHGNVVLEQGLGERFRVKRERESSRGMNRTVH
jgi:hypothetical protein